MAQQDHVGRIGVILAGLGLIAAVVIVLGGCSPLWFPGQAVIELLGG